MLRDFSRLFQTRWTRFHFHVDALRALRLLRGCRHREKSSRELIVEPISRVSFIVAVPYLRMTHCCHEYREEILPSIQLATFRTMTLDRGEKKCNVYPSTDIRSIDVKVWKGLLIICKKWRFIGKLFIHLQKLRGNHSQISSYFTWSLSIRINIWKNIY